MKRILLLFLGIFGGLNSFSQKQFVQIKTDINNYFTDTTYSQIDFKCTNITDTSCLLWIEKGNVDSLSIDKKIRKHFYTKKGDWSLIQMIWDGSFSQYTPHLFDTFLKVIKPKEQFTITTLVKGKFSTSSNFVKKIESQIIVVNATEIKGLTSIDNLDMFIYKPNQIAILGEWFKGIR